VNPRGAGQPTPQPASAALQQAAASLQQAAASLHTGTGAAASPLQPQQAQAATQAANNQARALLNIDKAAKSLAAQVALMNVTVSTFGRTAARAFGEARHAIVDLAGAAAPGALLLYQRAWADLNATVGQAFVPVLNLATSAVRTFGGILYALPPRWKAVAAIALTAAGAVGLFVTGAIGLAAALGGAAVAVAALVANIGPIAAVLGGLAAAALAAGGAVAALFGTAQGRALAREFARDVIDAGRATIDWAQSLWQSLKPALEGVWGAVGRLMGAFHELYRAAKPVLAELGQAIGEGLTAQIMGTVGAVRLLIEQLTEVVRLAKDLKEMVEMVNPALGMGKQFKGTKFGAFADEFMPLLVGKVPAAFLGFGGGGGGGAAKPAAAGAAAGGGGGGGNFLGALLRGDLAGAVGALGVPMKSNVGLAGFAGGTGGIEAEFSKVFEAAGRTGETQADIQGEIRDIFRGFVAWVQGRAGEDDRQPPPEGGALVVR
jgi:hypothetical protein